MPPVVPTPNPLGFQIEQVTPGAKRLVEATWPWTLKVMHGGIDLALLAEWRNRQPNGLLVGRHVFDPGPLTEMAARLERTVGAFRPLLALGGPVAIELPFNEEHQNGEDLIRLAEASVPAAATAIASGFRVVSLITSEGNPHGTPADPFADWRDPRLQAALYELRALSEGADDVPWLWWGPHEYSAPPLEPVDGWHCGRWGKVLDLLPEPCRLPVLITECGIDGGVDTGQGPRRQDVGWRGYRVPSGRGRGGTSNAAAYADWLRAVRAAIAADPRAWGGHVFLAGAGPGGRWRLFDVAGEPELEPVFAEAVGAAPRWTGRSAPENGASAAPGGPGARGEAVSRPKTGAARMDPENNPWRGKVLSVWNLPAEPADLIGWGQRLGLDGFEIKTADGNSPWLASPKRRLTPAYVGALKAAGFRVMGWSYNYCDGERAGPRDRGDGLPEHEARVAAQAVTSLGLDGHTFDLETEAEGHADLVAQLFEAARGLLGVPLAAHVWAYRAGHERYPFELIAAHADVLRPMVYEDTWNAPECWRQLGDLFAGRVVCPVWSLTDANATAERLRSDQRVADEHGCPGVGFWEYTGLPGLAGVVEAIQAIRYGEPAPPSAELVSLRDRTWRIAEEWATAGWPWLSQLLKGAVSLSKGER